MDNRSTTSPQSHSSLVAFVRRVAAIVFKELTQLKRDRLTFGMIVMIPLVQLMLFGYAINTNIRNIPVAIVDHANSGLSRVLQQTIAATQVVTFTEQYATEAEAQQALQRSTVRAVLVLPHDLDNRLARSSSVGLGLPPATDEETSQPIGSWLVDGSDTVVAAAIKSLRNLPLLELLDKPANRQVPTFAVALFYNPEQRTAVNIVPG
ncbi:MAG: ABC transporter permease, partial [Gammaproteobacteria bacterium]|nr:ABC transporter permease [Gammaproteobacteria bacterium]